MAEIRIANRKIGEKHKPFVIAEVGINHEGNIKKALRMIDDAYKSGAECVKFQSHIVDDEMIPNKVVPGNATETIWDMMTRCQLSEKEEIQVKEYVESKGMLYLCTPFSRASADRLHRMGVKAFKIGSGECNNYPLVEHIAKFKKPIILSTGMNNIDSIKVSVKILQNYKVPFALLHCTSMYPTPYDRVRLGALQELKNAFPEAVLGLSDHSLGNYTCYGAVVYGASILEKHFTSNKRWKGSDIPISIGPSELRELIEGTAAIHQALGGNKCILKDEKPTIDFAYACVVSTEPIKKGAVFTKKNIWVKRPGTGEIKAKDYSKILNKRTNVDIPANTQISWKMIAENSQKETTNSDHKYTVWERGLSALQSSQHINNTILATGLAKLGYKAIVEKYIYVYPSNITKIFKLVPEVWSAIGGVGIDLGGGVGCVASTLAKKQLVNSIYCVEIVKETVELCQPLVKKRILKNNQGKVISVLGNFDFLELEDNSLDFALSWDSMHHSENLLQTLKEVRRVLKPGSLFVIVDRAHNDATPNSEIKRMLNIVYSKEFLKENFREENTVLTRKENGEHEYRFSEWKNCFSKAGFDLQRVLVIKTDTPENRKIRNDYNAKEQFVNFKLGGHGHRKVMFVLKA
ncbi:MAG: hypothetical protein ACD_22C00041G0004 [uncultured bacterium]|nr:MAG: hypothetical protein ACD_22C00041G0004 [uncultured bacterium]